MFSILIHTFERFFSRSQIVNLFCFSVFFSSSSWSKIDSSAKRFQKKTIRKQIYLQRVTVIASTFRKISDIALLIVKSFRDCSTHVRTLNISELSSSLNSIWNIQCNYESFDNSTILTALTFQTAQQFWQLWQFWQFSNFDSIQILNILKSNNFENSKTLKILKIIDD